MYSQQMFNEYNQDTGNWSHSRCCGRAICRSCRVVHGGHTSQQRTRSRKRMTSLCFFFASSSRYLWAPICGQRC